VYAIRTVVLPFIWIFNPALLLIDVHGWFEALLVAAASTVASLLFAAATMRWLRVRCRWWEVLLLLVATFVLFRPDWFADRIAPEYRDAPAAQLYEVAARLDEGDRLVFVIAGQTLEGEARNKTVALPMGPRVDDPNLVAAARKRLAEAGMTVSGVGSVLQVTNVRFGSAAAKARIEPGFEIVGVKVPTDRINAHWFYVPGLLLALLIWWIQGARMRRGAAPAAA
jgi:hypothetical protein